MHGNLVKLTGRPLAPRPERSAKQIRAVRPIRHKTTSGDKVRDVKNRRQPVFFSEVCEAFEIRDEGPRRTG
jgi:hypothetical protein